MSDHGAMHGCRASAKRQCPGRDGQRGQAIIEMIVVLPLLLFLVFGIVEFAAAWRTYHVVTNSSREGARRAVVSSSTSEVTDAVEARLSAGGLDPSLAVISVSCENEDGTMSNPNDACGSDEVGKADRVQVVFPYTFRVLGPVANLICGGSCGDAYGTVDLTALTVMRHE